MENSSIQSKTKGLNLQSKPDPCIIVIFGASGDLSHRELFPAIYSLTTHNLLTKPWSVIGVDIKEFSDESFRDEMKKAITTFSTFDDKTWKEFEKNIYYVTGDFKDSPEGSYKKLSDKINEIKTQKKIPDNILFHLATPQSFYAVIAERLGAAGLNKSPDGWRRIIIEKPFGDDEQSAKELDKKLHNIFKEEQIYRVDHFLGKETVQNMLVFRFANPSFEPIWNRNFIENIQISASEFIGIGSRGNFYEKTGIIKDMVQNHLLQLLCMATIEPPLKYDSDSLRSETVKVLKAVCPIKKEDVVLGQYNKGEVKGAQVKSYREEDNVSKNSMVPTFAAIRLFIDNWRWAGVPFYLRTGKRMKETDFEVTITFKPTPHLMFLTNKNEQRGKSILSFQLQPNEGIIHQFLGKQPGSDITLTPVKMNFRYSTTFGIDKPPSAYQWLIFDAITGDQTLFPRSDWIYNAWSIVDPIIKEWNDKPWLSFPNYKAGSWGPAESDKLLLNNQKWHNE